MQELLCYVSTTDSAVMHEAFIYYKETKLDFVDCILAAYSIIKGKGILSFDKKLNNFIVRKLEEI